MGALHEGHLSLVRAARAENDVVIASVFVNPAQFAAGEDFERYPRDPGGDFEKLKAHEVDFLFLPDAAAMYPKGFATTVCAKGLSEKMCGAFRPGHFGGVATVVLKLLNITLPARAYFGLKDYQQTLIIRRLVKDLNVPVEIVPCPTLREPDGLAMSSRNSYLSAGERRAAPVLYRALSEGAGLLKGGQRDLAAVREAMRRVLRSEPLVAEIQYASAFDPETLEEPQTPAGPGILLAGAIKIGAARLIDNIVVDDLK
jgi:pantoate--beta-alanine ligase